MKNEALPQAKLLLKLAARNKSEQIKKTLNTIRGTTKYKGDVFEHFIAELYKNTGWNAEVVGGKGDKGVDILLYHPETPSEVEAIIQTKNSKTPLSSRALRHEYGNFFGNDYSHSKGSSEIHNCKKLIIISLNGYVKDSKNFTHTHEKTHNISHQDWSDVEILIEKYSKKPSKIRKHLKIPALNPFFSVIYGIKTILDKAKENVAIIVIVLMVLVFFLTDNPRNTKDEHEDYLTDAMIERLQKVKLTKSRKADCKRLKYTLKTCPEKLVIRYTDKYGNGNLETGLIVYFCGQGNFKKDKCGKHSKRRAWHILAGE